MKAGKMILKIGSTIVISVIFTAQAARHFTITFFRKVTPYIRPWSNVCRRFQVACTGLSSLSLTIDVEEQLELAILANLSEIIGTHV